MDGFFSFINHSTVPLIIILVFIYFPYPPSFISIRIIAIMTIVDFNKIYDFIVLHPHQ